MTRAVRRARRLDRADSERHLFRHVDLTSSSAARVARVRRTLGGSSSGAERGEGGDLRTRLAAEAYDGTQSLAEVHGDKGADRIAQTAR